VKILVLVRLLPLVEVNGNSRPTIFRGILPRKERSVRYVHVQLDPGYNFILVRLLQGQRGMDW
jgi:hypothetical protein